jgi:hypothetical protein
MALSILNQYFPTDISKMILEMKDKSEHYDKMIKIFIPMQIKSIISFHDQLLRYIYHNYNQYEDDNYIHDIDYFTIKQMEKFSMDNSECIGYILKILSYCDCCMRHKHNKPNGIYSNKKTYDLWFDEDDDKKYIHYDENNDDHDHKHKTSTPSSCSCECSCRNISRHLLRSYHNIYNPSIFNSSVYHERFHLLSTLHIINNNIKYNFERIKQLKIKTKHVMSRMNNLMYDDEYDMGDIYYQYDGIKEQITYYEDRNTNLNIEYNIARTSLEDHIEDYPNIPVEEKYKNIYELVIV